MYIYYFQGAPTRSCVHENKMKMKVLFVKVKILFRKFQGNSCRKKHQGNSCRYKHQGNSCRNKQRTCRNKQNKTCSNQNEHAVSQVSQINKNMQNSKLVIKVDYKTFKTLKVIKLAIGQLILIVDFQSCFQSCFSSSIQIVTDLNLLCFLVFVEESVCLKQTKVNKSYLGLDKTNTWVKDWEGWKDTCCCLFQSLVGVCGRVLGWGGGFGWWITGSYGSSSISLTLMLLDDPLRVLLGVDVAFQWIHSTKHKRRLEDTPVANRSKDTNRVVSLISSWQVKIAWKLVPTPIPCHIMLQLTPTNNHHWSQPRPITDAGQITTTVDLQTQSSVNYCSDPNIITFTCQNCDRFSAT